MDTKIQFRISVVFPRLIRFGVSMHHTFACFGGLSIQVLYVDYARIPRLQSMLFGASVDSDLPLFSPVFIYSRYPSSFSFVFLKNS